MRAGDRDDRIDLIGIQNGPFERLHAAERSAGDRRKPFDAELVEKRPLGPHHVGDRDAAEHRDVALDVLVDMLRNSKFDPEEIEREKGVIVEEMNMYYDTPRDYVDGVYDELLYGDQPLGWDIIGRKETVRAAQSAKRSSATSTAGTARRA